MVRTLFLIACVIFTSSYVHAKKRLLHDEPKVEVQKKRVLSGDEHKRAIVSGVVTGVTAFVFTSMSALATAYLWLSVDTYFFYEITEFAIPAAVVFGLGASAPILPVLLAAIFTGYDNWYAAMPTIGSFVGFSLALGLSILGANHLMAFAPAGLCAGLIAGGLAYHLTRTQLLNEVE